MTTIPRKRLPYKTAPIRICPICETSFRRTHSRPGIYCSQECYQGSRKRQLSERFWEKVLKTDSCWLWIAGHNSAGYGWFNIAGKCNLAHRAAWELSVGSIPEGLDVLHRCDIPACVNPDHLFLGTQLENIADMRQKGRGRAGVGERHRSAKYTEAFIRLVRQLHANGASTKQLAGQFGVNPSTMYDILVCKTWKHIR
jgi:hypothetical protein